jgi:hypothetical protein
MHTCTHAHTYTVSWEPAIVRRTQSSTSRKLLPIRRQQSSAFYFSTHQEPHDIECDTSDSDSSPHEEPLVSRPCRCHQVCDNGGDQFPLPRGGQAGRHPNAGVHVPPCLLLIPQGRFAFASLVCVRSMGFTDNNKKIVDASAYFLSRGFVTDIFTKPTPPPAICAMRSHSLLTLYVSGFTDQLNLDTTHRA